MIHQMVYEGKLKYTDPDKYKDFMKAKAAHDNGDDNAVESNTSYQGRGTSGGAEALKVKHYSMEPKASEAKERASNYQSMADGNESSDVTSSDAEVSTMPSPETSDVSGTIDANQGTDFSTDEQAPDAQSFADKYKLNLLNKGEGETDFSGV